MRSPLQQTLLEALAGVLRPLARLLLQAGVGYAEFSSVAKAVFVQVASDRYGIRGRPTNMSRVSAITGISRKQVKLIRNASTPTRWNPKMEGNPVNVVLHYWHHDPEFAAAPGVPRCLPFEGPSSFSSLVFRYAGDIPPGAMRTELIRAGVAIEDADGGLTALSRYFHSTNFDEDFIRRIAFSLQNLASTVVHNAELHQDPAFDEAMNVRLGRFERCAWAEHIGDLGREQFRIWARQEGARFIERVDSWLGEHEMPEKEWESTPGRTVGVGVYYFEEDAR
jgi:hypothetical protein